MGRTNIQKMSEIIWLNNQQAIPPSPTVQEAFLSQASSFPWSLSYNAQKLEEAVRTLVNPSSHRFHIIPHYPYVFTILTSILLENKTLFQGRDHLLLSSHEQQYIIDALTQSKNSTYDWVPLDRSGTVSHERLAEALSPRSLLFSLSAANGVTGLVEPIQELGNLCKERGVLFHLDISDILGRLQISPEILSADIITFSSRAIGGVSSIGAMFIHSKFSDLFAKWLPRTSSRTICNGALAAMHAACLERKKALTPLTLTSIHIKNTLQKEFKNIPGAQFLFADAQHKLPNVMVAVIPNIPAESLSFFLNQQDIFVGMGEERFQPIAQILQASGISPFLCHSAIHLSCNEHTKSNSCAYLAQSINQGLVHLQPALMNCS